MCVGCINIRRNTCNLLMTSLKSNKNDKLCFIYSIFRYILSSVCSDVVKLRLKFKS